MQIFLPENPTKEVRARLGSGTQVKHLSYTHTYLGYDLVRIFSCELDVNESFEHFCPTEFVSKIEVFSLMISFLFSSKFAFCKLYLVCRNVHKMVRSFFEASQDDRIKMTE